MTVGLDLRSALVALSMDSSLDQNVFREMRFLWLILTMLGRGFNNVGAARAASIAFSSSFSISHNLMKVLTLFFGRYLISSSRPHSLLSIYRP
jgi:hypothetical protein